jgi:hypothetical protein
MVSFQRVNENRTGNRSQPCNTKLIRVTTTYTHITPSGIPYRNDSDFQGRCTIREMRHAIGRFCTCTCHRSSRAKVRYAHSSLTALSGLHLRRHSFDPHTHCCAANHTPTTSEHHLTFHDIKHIELPRSTLDKSSNGRGEPRRR